MDASDDAGDDVGDVQDADDVIDGDTDRDAFDSDSDMDHGDGDVDEDDGRITIALYETFVIVLELPDVEGNRFAAFPSAVFTRGDQHVDVDGFYDGDDTWRVRFMPDQEGDWSYSWSFESHTGRGSFTVTERINPLNRGHIQRQGRYVVDDEGQGFHFLGANWPSIAHLRPNPDFDGFDGHPQFRYFQDSEWEAYMDRLLETGHNGNYFTGMERLMNNDRASFNLEWAQRIDWALEEAGQRGIYMFLNIFNTWGRTANNPYDWVAIGEQQLLNPWDLSTHAEATELLIRYLVARYAGYYNVMWELGNEMEHTNDGNAFVQAANSTYIPSLREHDPYDLPITLSEDIWMQTDVDIGGYHHMQRDPTSDRPTMLTELVGAAALWMNSRYADPAYRSAYRHPFWTHFTSGGSGSMEATNLFDHDIHFATLTDFLNDPNILAVMNDHGRLANFLETLETPIQELQPSLDIGMSSNGYLAIGNPGQEYVAYWAGQGLSSPTLNLALPPGNYRARWYYPTTGVFSPFVDVTSGDSIVAPPLNSNDVVLYIVSE